MGDESFARGMWWWMPGAFMPAAEWCVKNCKGKWTSEIDAAAMGFELKADYDDFKSVFPRRTLEYEKHYEFEGPRKAWTN